MRKLDTITLEQAVAALIAAAGKDFASVEAQLKAAGFGITGYAPLQGRADLDASAGSNIGSVIEGRGIYHGAWQPQANSVIVHAYSDKDFLKDGSGKQLLLNWYEARDELSRRNDGRKYGDGTEQQLTAVLVKPAGTQGAYQDGDLIMGPQVLLNGVDRDGKKARTQNTFDLLSRSKGSAFKNISETLRDGSDIARWSWSCTEDRGNPSLARAVRLWGGNGYWVSRDVIRLGVLPFRVFREPHVTKAVNHLNI